MRDRILVTGSLGFIGSHLVRALLERSSTSLVVGYDVITYCSSIKSSNLLRETYPESYEFIQGDIRDSERVQRVLRESKINCVFHLAAHTSVDASFQNPMEFTSTNILGTHTLLEAVRFSHPQIRRFVHMSTDEVYGEILRDTLPAKENDPFAPTNPYAASKASGDLLASTYGKCYNIPLIIVRPNNVYGPHQFPEKVMPLWILSILRGEKCTLHGNGSNSRRYIYINDLISALLCIFDNGSPGDVYNVGSEHEISNHDLAGMLGEYMSPENKKVDLEYTHDRLYNDVRYHVNDDKLKSLGWKQQVPMKEGLSRTVTWYRHQIKLHDWWNPSPFA